MSYDIHISYVKEVYHSNYTCNVALMYYAAWDKVKSSLDIPSWELGEKEDWKHAIQLEQKYAIPTLKAMIDELLNNPDKYRKLNPDNGWGNYEGAVDFLERAYEQLLQDKYLRLRLDW